MKHSHHTPSVTHNHTVEVSHTIIQSEFKVYVKGVLIMFQFFFDGKVFDFMTSCFLLGRGRTTQLYVTSPCDMLETDNLSTYYLDLSRVSRTCQLI
jgi:hypothetical protein